MQGVLIFITKKMVAKMSQLPKIGFKKLLAKPTKEKEKEKEAVIYQKIAPPKKTLVDREGWKVSLLKGMYVAILPALI